MSLSAIPRALRAEVLRRDGGRCQYCGLVQIGQAAVFHINHVIPRSRGGATTLSNLVLQCPSCSLHKSNQTMATDSSTGESVALFHPLAQRWEEHFETGENGSCTGKTPVGRATVAALRMNDPLPRIARLLQSRLGIP